MKTFAIVPAAGRGVRMGMDKPKQFLDLLGKPLLVHTLDVLTRAGFLSGICLVVPKDFEGAALALCEEYLDPKHRAGSADIHVVVGGAERQDSVANALSSVPSDCKWVLVHDGVRPFVSPRLLVETWLAAGKTGACIAAVPSTDTVKRLDGDHVVETIPRETIWLVQTPQVFRKDILVKAYEEAERNGWSSTDDAALVERIGCKVTVVEGERSNIKVTTPEDLVWASFFLGRLKSGDRQAGEAPACV